MSKELTGNGEETTTTTTTTGARAATAARADEARRAFLSYAGLAAAAGVLTACVRPGQGESDESVAALAEPLQGTTFVWVDTIGTASSPGQLRGIGTDTVAGRTAVAQGFWAANDGGGGIFDWTLDTTSADDGGTIIVPYLTPRKGCWKRIFSGPLNVKWFGAKGDNTGDNTLPIQWALNAANARGGGAVYLPAGTYRLAVTSPPYGNALLLPRSNVEMFGDGASSILRAADGLNGTTLFNMIRQVTTDPDCPRLTNASFRDFVLDCNAAHNGGYNAQGDNAAIDIASGENLLFDRLSVIECPGSWCVVVGGIGETTSSEVTVRACRMVGVGSAVNPAQLDHSSICLYADRVLVRNNVCEGGTVLRCQGTAIEIHGSHVVCEGNVIRLYTNGINLGAQYTEHTDAVYAHNVVECWVGLACWVDPGHQMGEVVVEGNVFEQGVDCGDQPIIDLGRNVKAKLTSISILNNHIVCNVPQGRPGCTTGALHVRHAGTGDRGGPEVVSIKGNTFRGHPGPAVDVAGSWNGTLGVSIEHNQIVDCGTSTADWYDCGIKIMSPETLASCVIAGNVVRNTSTQYMQVGISGNMVYSHMDIHGNTFVNVPTGVDYFAPGSYGTSAPAAGTWLVGDLVWKTAPAAGGPIGWVCVGAGAPGVWKAFGAIDP